jgi:hypothetical protein
MKKILQIFLIALLVWMATTNIPQQQEHAEFTDDYYQCVDSWIDGNADSAEGQDLIIQAHDFCINN